MPDDITSILAWWEWRKLSEVDAPRDEALIGALTIESAPGRSLVLGEVWRGPTGDWYEADCKTPLRCVPTHWMFMPRGPVKEECAPGDHAFEMDGPPPWPCTFCGYTPALMK